MEYAFGSLILAFLLITHSMLERRLKRADKRLYRMERRLDAIMKAQGITAAEPELAEVDRLLAADKKIKAIREYREITGAGLSESKEAVDARQHR